MRLRSDLLLSMDRGRAGETIWLLRDPVTQRFFSLPSESKPLLDFLALERTPDEVVAEFADSLDPESVEGLLDALRDRHLFDEGMSASSLRSLAAHSNREASFRALRDAVELAVATVPAYRDRLSRLPGGLTTVEELLQIPLLTRADMRVHFPLGFVPEGMNLESLRAEGSLDSSASSGSSVGERLKMLFNPKVRRMAMIAGALLNGDLFEHLEVNSTSLTTMHCADPNICVRDQPRPEDRLRANQLLLIPPEDPGAPTLDEAKRILDEIRAHNVAWLDCSASFLAAVTYAVLDAGLEVPRVKVITCCHEYPSAIHRNLLRDAWGCNVYSRLGASEVGNIEIMECERGGLHINERYYFAEVVRDGRHSLPGELGRLVITTLKETFPLIRYDTEDVVTAASDEPCPCGNASRRVASIGGRACDLTMAVDGSPRTTRDVDEALAAVNGIRFYQVHQLAAKRYRAKVVIDPRASAETVVRLATEVLLSVYGAGAEVLVERARRIYPEASDKFRLCRSELADPAARVVATS